MPLYGDGLNERDWLYVDDDADAIAIALGKGPADVVSTAAWPDHNVGKALVRAQDLAQPVPDGHWRAVVAAFARFGATPPASGEVGD